jgi:glucose/arabinose dehydrogenase
MGGAYRDPIMSFDPSSNQFLTALLEGIRDKASSKHEWPAEAPSSIEVYTSDAIPGWKNSLLITTLKGGKLIRLLLDDKGERVVGDTICYFHGPVRYRDIAIAPDGKRLYLALDSTAVTSGPSAENPKAINYRGVILECTYEQGNPAATHENPVADTSKQMPAVKKRE